jgi:3',5'-cyclic AMP phosphodiesterase CpdA
MGYANWHVRRRGRHDMACLANLTLDMQSQAPDHIACTGDLAVIGLDAEFTPARAFLEKLGDAQHVSLVPGNHDSYVRGTADHPQLHWSEYMTGDGERVEGEPHFPYIRRRGPLAIVGVTTAVPTGFHSAQGRIGKVQARALTDILKGLGEEGMFRVVLIHHPPGGTEDILRRLTDARRIKRAMLLAGAELILHGHNHLSERRSLLGRDGMIPVIGVPSASAAPTDNKEPGAYNLYRIGGQPGAWSCEMIQRGYVKGTTDVVERQRLMLIEPDQARIAVPRDLAS